VASGRSCWRVSARSFILGRIEAEPSISLRALAAELRERGIVVSYGAVAKPFISGFIDVNCVLVGKYEELLKPRLVLSRQCVPDGHANLPRFVVSLNAPAVGVCPPGVVMRVCIVHAFRKVPSCPVVVNESQTPLAEEM